MFVSGFFLPAPFSAVRKRYPGPGSGGSGSSGGSDADSDSDSGSDSGASELSVSVLARCGLFVTAVLNTVY